MKNMVDERFELCSLVFRFTKDSGHSETETNYQREIEEKFKKFAHHPAIEYANSFDTGYDAVPLFAFNIEKKDGEFVFIHDDLRFLKGDGRWSEDRSKKFLKLLNDFYKDTNYADFYHSKITFFEEETQKFIEQSYKKVDLEWFGKHMDISKEKCFHSPSLTRSNFGARVGEYHYTVVPIYAKLVHEYCHYFANPIAYKWYNDNAEFKKMCNDTAVLKKIPFYETGLTFAFEYVTRAYDILYRYQHGDKDINKLFSMDRNYYENDSFPYIEQIYNMVLALEKHN